MTSLVTIVSTLFGYGVVAARLRGKLDTAIYQAGQKDQWDRINSQGNELAELKGELRAIKELKK